MYRLLSIGLLLILVACSRSTDRDKHLKTLKTIRSWTATAQMVGDTWQRGHLPQQYARQTLIKSQTEITKEAKQLSAPPVVLTQMQQNIQTMAAQIDRPDQMAFSAALQKLSSQQRQLDALMTAQEQQP
jgi:hypothetical protein